MANGPGRAGMSSWAYQKVTWRNGCATHCDFLFAPLSVWRSSTGHMRNPGRNVVLVFFVVVGILPSVLIGRWSSLVSDRSRLETLQHIGEGSASQLIVTVSKRFVR